MAGERRSRRARASILPFRSRNRLSNTVSCWYCDVKFSCFNSFLTVLGTRHARFFRLWFTFGVGISFMASIIISMILLQQLACTLLNFRVKRLCNLPFYWLAGVPSLVSALKLFSLLDGGIMIFASLISVLIHEFGHAVAASSQGLQIEYIAMFLSIIFPGAFVAINENVLQTLPSLAALRVYCAGVWHNFVFSVACALLLLSLPTALYPMLIHGDRPTVLSVPAESPLAGHLSSGDIILSLNGHEIHSPMEWSEKIAKLDPKSPNHSHNDSQPSGYCIPLPLIEEKSVPAVEGEKACPGDLVAFRNTVSDENYSDEGYCFRPQEVIKLKKCGPGCISTGSNSSCLCSEDEWCLGPDQSAYSVWMELSFSRSHLSECLKFMRNKKATVTDSCLQTLVYVGDISMANSINLTAYYPRWAIGSFLIYIPNILERIILSMLRVSAGLGLLNSMPVFHLDGEFMLEIILDCIKCFDPPTRRKILRVILVAGSSLTAITILRLIFSIYFGQI